MPGKCRLLLLQVILQVILSKLCAIYPRPFKMMPIYLKFY